MQDKFKEMLDHLVDEKMGYKEYKEIADRSDNPEYKEMFNHIAEDEYAHYSMIKEYLAKMIQE